MNWNAAAIALLGLFCVSGGNDTIVVKVTKEHWEFQCSLNMTASKYDSSLSIKFGGICVQLNALIDMNASSPSQIFRLNAHICLGQFNFMLSLFG